MGSSSKIDKNDTEKKPSEILKKQQSKKEPSRRSFWYRLKNFTFESPKKVVMDGDTVRLVPITPELPVVEEITPVAELPAAETPVVLLPEVPVEIEVKIEEPIEVPQETIVVEEPVIVEKAEEKPAAAVIEVPVVEVPEIEKEVKPIPVLPDEKLKKGLEKTRGRFWSRLKGFFSFKRKIDESVLEELEDILIGADIGVKPVHKLIQELREAWQSKAITETSQIYDFIKDRLKEDLKLWDRNLHYAPASPTVIMVVGVNGVGKTTSIAKLACHLIQDGKTVLVAAGDTFRAAAVDQLEVWSKRVGADIVKHKTGSDPAAVAFDAIEASIARGTDVLIIDTAGRLHTHENLMNELIKIKRVIAKKIPDAPHEVLMVLDATTGQNAISQAKMFKQAVDVTGIFLAKLDGTAKGGIVLGMRNEINIPVKFVGLGEKPEDIEQFNPDAFVNALFDQERAL